MLTWQGIPCLASAPSDAWQVVAGPHKMSTAMTAMQRSVPHLPALPSVNVTHVATAGGCCCPTLTISLSRSPLNTRQNIKGAGAQTCIPSQQPGLHQQTEAKYPSAVLKASLKHTALP